MIGITKNNDEMMSFIRVFETSRITKIKLIARWFRINQYDCNQHIG